MIFRNKLLIGFDAISEAASKKNKGYGFSKSAFMDYVNFHGLPAKKNRETNVYELLERDLYEWLDKNQDLLPKRQAPAANGAIQ